MSSQIFPLLASSLLAMHGQAPTQVPENPRMYALDAVDEAIAAAGKDATKLAQLGEQWDSEGEYEAAAKAYGAALAIDPDHAAAHGGLGHHACDGRWYTTYAELARASREEARVRLEKDGVVRLGDDWVPVQEAPFRRMGWEKLADGRWARPGTLARLADGQQKEGEGYQLQHLTWVHPSEFEQWRKGLFKVGDEWLEVAQANVAHAEIGAWWEVPGEHFVALTTVVEEDSRWVVWWADQTAADLSRIFGLVPAEKPELVVLNSLAQYNEFAAGSQSPPRVPADASGHSSLHYAFFTDGWTESVAGSAVPVFRGTGAAYYDSQDAALAPFGQHAVRHAAALAWLESVDPSWSSVSRMVTSPSPGFPDLAFWSEKRIPRWLRYGAAAYCERFFEDAQVGEGGDPLWARKWAIENLKGSGPLDSMSTILELEFDTADPVASARRIQEAGLLVHFIVDGDDQKVNRAWRAYRGALMAGDAIEEELGALEEAVRRAEKSFAKTLR